MKLPRLGIPVVAVAILGIGTEAAAHPAPFSFIDVSVRTNAVDVAAVVHIWDVAHEYGIDDPNELLDEALVKERAHSLGGNVSSIPLAGDVRQPHFVKGFGRQGVRGRNVSHVVQILLDTSPSGDRLGKKDRPRIEP